MGRKAKTISGICLACGSRFTKMATRGNQLMACDFSPCIEKARPLAEKARQKRKTDIANAEYTAANERFLILHFSSQIAMMETLYEELYADNSQVKPSLRNALTSYKINQRENPITKKTEIGLAQIFFGFLRDRRGGITPADLFRKKNSAEQAAAILATREAAKGQGYSENNSIAKSGAVAWLLGDDAALQLTTLDERFTFDKEDAEEAITETSTALACPTPPEDEEDAVEAVYAPLTADQARRLEIKAKQAAMKAVEEAKAAGTYVEPVIAVDPNRPWRFDEADSSI